LLGTLIEKFLPEAARRRRAEAAEEREADRARHALRQSFALRVAALEEGAMAVQLWVRSLSRCPMHAGSTIPLGFYVARAYATFPEGWSPRERVVVESAAGAAKAWEMRSRPPQEALFSEEDVPSMSERGLRQALDERGIDHRQCLEREELVALLTGFLRAAPSGAEGAVDVVLHFQPRFQLAPATMRLALHDGSVASLDAEFDSRVIHR